MSKVKILNPDEIILMQFQKFLDSAKDKYERNEEDDSREFYLFNYFQIAYALIEKYVSMYYQDIHDFNRSNDNEFVQIRKIANALKHNPNAFSSTFTIQESKDHILVKFKSTNFEGRSRDEEVSINVESLDEYHSKLKRLSFRFEEESISNSE